MVCGHISVASPCRYQVWAKDTIKDFNTTSLFFPLMKKVIFLLSGSFCLYNQCSLETPINESFPPFLHTPCCLPQSPRVLVFLFVRTWLGVWSQKWYRWRVSGRSVQKSPGALSSQRWKMFWIPSLSSNLKIDCAVTWLSSVSAQRGAVSTLPVLRFSF